MGHEVEEGEEDREDLLDAQNTVERPLPVELDHRVQHWRVTVDPAIRDYMLAGVIAFGVACPQHQSQIEGYSSPLARLHVTDLSILTEARVPPLAVFGFTDLAAMSDP